MLRKLEWDELTIGFIFISIMFQGKIKMEKTKHLQALKRVKGYYVTPATEYSFAMNTLHKNVLCLLKIY